MRLRVRAVSGTFEPGRRVGNLLADRRLALIHLKHLSDPLMELALELPFLQLGLGLGLGSSLG